jgi:16S rRNA (adenine1518-N6/adenine1519-N6)-dimethyltransferase
VYQVKPKKSLGQHFLADRNIAAKIVGSLTFRNYRSVLEVGPGTGILTSCLLKLGNGDLKFVEIDRSSVAYLKETFPSISENIINEDILETDLGSIFSGPYAIIGNLPYNISSQIFFRILENRDVIKEVVCMVQKEVSYRITSPPGSREYGILSVLLQAFYDAENLFNVNPGVFRPPPKVMSSVMRLTRNTRQSLECDEKLFFKVVKTAFNQRRKMMRNSLREMTGNTRADNPYMEKRPEQIGVEDFIKLTKWIESISI